MDHVAIDLGGRESQVCIRNEKNEIQSETRVRTAQLKAFFGSLAPVRVVMETCAEAFAVALDAKEAGHDVRVVPSTTVRALGVGLRGIKTDQRDARCLSEASVRSELKSVHIPSELARELKSLCVMRDGLVRARTSLVNGVRGWHRQRLLQIPGGSTNQFHKRVQALHEVMKDQLPPCVERQLRAIEALSLQIQGCDDELTFLSNGSEDAKRLMTVPGIGPATSMRFLATIDRIERFKTPHELESYFGLTPGEYSSSDTKRRTGLTKAGQTTARWLLVQAAWSALRTRPHDPMVIWARNIGARKGKMAIAVVALARKMVGIMFALLRDRSSYSPARGAIARSADLGAAVASAAEVVHMARKPAKRSARSSSKPTSSKTSKAASSRRSKSRTANSKAP